LRFVGIVRGLVGMGRGCLSSRGVLIRYHIVVIVVRGGGGGDHHSHGCW
jgi:hypothetical protein